MDQFKVFENFSVKGVWYGFVGLLTLDVNGDATIDRRWQNVIACALIGFGGLHFLLGVLQFRYVREARLVVLRAQSDQTRQVKSQDGGDLDWAKDWPEPRATSTGRATPPRAQSTPRSLGPTHRGPACARVQARLSPWD